MTSFQVFLPCMYFCGQLALPFDGLPEWKQMSAVATTRRHVYFCTVQIIHVYC
jgi:hypothetical protein